MNALLVREYVDRLEAAGIEIWVDGGWGIDALLGEQTRDHSDLDLAISRDAVESAVALLGADGFAIDEHAHPGPPARIVLRDAAGQAIDLHPLIFDERGNGWQELGANAWGLYPASGLDATGSITGRRVRCLSAEVQLRHHLGWSWTSRDRADLERLAQQFELPLPPLTEEHR
jgi:lincosamide nucleotidyltransferase A/C/D/E